MTRDSGSTHAVTVPAPTAPDDLVAMLDLLAETIVQALGFGVAAINIARPDGTLEAVSVAGDEDARQALLGTVESSEKWDQLLEVTEHWGRLRFLDHTDVDARSIDLRYVADVEPIDADDAWHPEDALFAPLIAPGGAQLGILSVDVPHDGRRPDAKTRRALEAFVVSTALAIEHATLRARAEASERLFQQLASHDSLTGAGNRSLLLERLRHALSQRSGTRPLMGLVFLDLDGFKEVNDRFTHLGGDRVLVAVAQRLRAAVRAHDTVVRWGGDEFIVLLEQLDDAGTAMEVVRRIEAVVAEPVRHLDRDLRVTASVGLALLQPDEDVDVDELVRRADSAMYRAKRSGRGASVLFDPASEPPTRRGDVLDLLERAVSEDRVLLHYQPIVRVADGTMVGVEALLRLRADDDTLVFPGSFLDVGDSTGRLVPIEHEVLRLACAQAAAWVAHGHDLHMSVNVCVAQVAAITDFEAAVHAALESSGLPAERLVCELTEHTALDVTRASLDGMARLVADGVRFSVDDFGTGYGSMTYVRSMPVHELKVDRSFIAEAPEERAAEAIVRSVASLAGELGISCVAEGVETPEQHELLLASGVPLAQGYLYGRPMPAAELTALLRGPA